VAYKHVFTAHFYRACKGPLLLPPRVFHRKVIMLVATLVGTYILSHDLPLPPPSFPVVEKKER
jgi:hypothetical protein